MHYGFAFLQVPQFYYLLVIGGLALIPRARFTAEKAAVLGDEARQRLTPNLPQRVSLFIPGVCVFACIGLLGQVVGAVALLAAYLLLFVALIFWFKRRTA
ncbi:MAG: hypothetical protein AAFX76_09800 [Planctomycetota bacterium]